MYLGIHTALAHSPRDELRVLTAEIEDQQAMGMNVGVRCVSSWNCNSELPW
jgi:hypothetical protein